LSAPVTITEDGVVRRIERLETNFKATIARSLRGDARATALVIKLMEQFELKETPAFRPKQPEQMTDEELMAVIRLLTPQED
jgi:hypothetical protein